MNRERFEKIALASRFTPLERLHTKDGDILLAESYRNLDPKFREPHWQILWAIDRDGMDIARKLYFRFGSTTREERIAAATADAIRFMTDNKQAGRYD